LIAHPPVNRQFLFAVRQPGRKLWWIIETGCETNCRCRETGFLFLELATTYCPRGEFQDLLELLAVGDGLRRPGLIVILIFLLIPMAPADNRQERD